LRMSLRINTNVAALNAHRNMIMTDNKLSDSLERLSTGLRINKAADDASGMTIADSLRAQHLGIGQAVRNANDGISMVQTADGALQESINIVNTIKTKAIQAATDGQTTETRKAIQADIDKLMEELDVIAKTTSFNGQKLLSGAFTNKKIQIGAFANETATISIGSTESTKTGHISNANLSLASESGGEVQLTITSSITGEDITLSKIDIQSNNLAENGMGALADEVNRYSSVTGIKATAVVEVSTSSAIQAGDTGDGFAINGINIGAITVAANDSTGSLVSAINGKTTEHGVTAAIENDGTLTLTSSDGRAIAITGSISDVFGDTASQMSTQGYLALSQSGTSQFQINGIGAGATGTDITLTGDMTTVEDSIIAAGSTIAVGSMLAAGTVIGGDALIESTVTSSPLDYQLKAGSTLYSFSDIAKGTQIEGSVTVSGDTFASSATGVTAIEEDMLVAAGSTLTKYSTLGKGTVVTSQFISTASGSSVTYDVGDVLSDAVELSRDVTLSANMTLKYDSTSSDNTQIKAGSILAAGTTMGAKFEIGDTFNTTDGSGVIVSGGTTTSNIMLFDSLADATTAGGMTIKAGSLLSSGTVLILESTGGSTTWTGPTLVTNSGTIEYGDTISLNTAYTLSGDQVLSEDFTSAGSTSGASTINSGSVLTTGFVAAENGLAATDGAQVTLVTATMADDMTLKAGSELQTGSKMLSGSEMGANTYVMGGSLNATATTISTYARTELAAGSTLQGDSGNQSILGEGSTIGGNMTVSGDTTLDSDMSVTTGTVFTNETMFKAGTVMNQDMTLNTATNGGGTDVEVKAGDVLTDDLYVSADNTTLSADMTLLEDSIVGSGTVLAVNTSNSGSVGLSDIESMRLSDLSVLTQADAQNAINIAEAALKDLDKTRSGLGSVQNQLVSTIANLSVTKTNIQASESAVRDVDFAEEASNFSKMQLLSQTGSFAMAQANAASQNILSLLQ
jgi:flagellin